MIFRSTPRSATEWIVRLNAGPLTWWDRRALNRWVAASPKHLQELEAAQAVNEIAQGLAGSRVARQYLAHEAQAFAPPLPRFGFALPSLATAALAAVLVVTISPWNTPSMPRLADQGQARTAVGEIADYVLPDNSQITVAGASSVSVAFSDSRREVSLDQGEAFFDVQPDVRRPFVITAGARKVTVTGTSFNVNYLAAMDEMEVAVVEGTVNVAFPSLSGGGETETMRAGDVILFPAMGRPLVRRNLTAQQVSAWRSRKLYFDAANLSQVLSEVNRYSTKPVVSETRDIDKLMLSGQFQAGDVDSVLISLQQLYGIEARETEQEWVLARKPSPARR
jgi:transmembrane sensor